MRLTKLTHACVRLEHEGAVVTVDPGMFSETAEALDGASAVLITHEHADHVDTDAVRAALDADSALHVWAPAAVAAGFGDRATAVGPGESFTVAGMEVSTYGGQHALIHPLVPMCANVGYRIAGGGSSVYHPGDSFVVPTDPVDVLLVPTSGPWLKLAEAADFAAAVRSPRAYQIHDALLSPIGTTVTERVLGGLVSHYGVELAHLDVRMSVQV